MSTLVAIMETQRTLESTFAQRFAELDSALRSVSPRSHTTIKSLSEDVSSFKEHVNGMLLLLRQQIEAVSNTVDSIEMRHRKKYLLFGGVPEAESECIGEVIVSVCQQKLTLPEVICDSILVCHRIGNKTDRPRPVLVRFSDSQIRNKIWAKKTALKGSSIVVSEFLTRQRQLLFVAARKHFGMRSVWSLDGNIHIKLPGGKKQRVTTPEQLALLTSQHAPVQPTAGSFRGRLAPAAAPGTSSAHIAAVPANLLADDGLPAIVPVPMAPRVAPVNAPVPGRPKQSAKQAK